MTTSNPREIPFNGVRLRFESKKSFDELVSALLADVGKQPLEMGPTGQPVSCMI